VKLLSSITTLLLLVTGIFSQDRIEKQLELARTALAKKTAVPVLLPTKLPHLGAYGEVFVRANGTRDDYQVIITSRKDCTANSCLVAVFQAERDGPTPAERDFDKVITLADGTRGFYSERSCGVSCAPPQIDFIYKSVRYSFQFVSIGTPQEDERKITDVANSVLASPRM